MRKKLLIFSFTLLSFSGFAQSVKGVVKNDDNIVMEKVSMTLLKTSDSSIVKMSASDKSGAYHIVGAPVGSFILSATSIGYTPFYKNVVIEEDKNITVETIILSKQSKELAGVTVQTKRPLVEAKADRMVVNIEGTINAIGNDGIELLRKSPGVLVDKDDNISLAGKNGVVIYVDGKQSPLKGTELANYLKSLQSSSIEAIELITNPSAKYDAAGNAGIINIKLKKNKAYGTNGAVTLGFAQGLYSRYNGGLSLNHRNKNLNIFGSYDYGYNKNKTKMNIATELMDSLIDQKNNMYVKTPSHNFKVGSDFFVSKKSTVGFLINGAYSDNNMALNGSSKFYPKNSNTLVKILEANSLINSNNNNTNFNTNYKFTSSDGKDFNFDIDYGMFRNKSGQYIPNIYYSPDMSTIYNQKIYRMDAPSDIDILSFKTDYEQNYRKGKLGFGAKMSHVKSDNILNRYNIINNNESYDNERSNRFLYKEIISALYVNYNKQYKGFLAQVGVRAEHTTSKGSSLGFKNNAVYDSTFNRNYVDFFPSAAVTINKNPMSQWTLSYSRRIDRPAYSQLNPFEFLSNEYMYQKGNVYLKPQYTNAFTLTHVYKYKLTTTLSYSHIKDLFAQYLYTDSVGSNGSKHTAVFQTTENLATQDVFNLNIGTPINKKWYNGYYNLTTTYNMYKSKKLGGSTNNINATLFGQNTFKLNKTLNGELSVLYISPFVWGGTFKGKAMHSIDLGLSKTILKGNGTLKASVSDIFNGMRFVGYNVIGARSDVDVKWESRVFKLNFSYRFGGKQIKAARQRKTGIEDEKKRTGGAGGFGQE
ncbi:MAG: TonB-dependent receptor [Chitinophagaceae bacterium]|nr:MAG: TonB-dependent receptor [Chitinophagaceae bacterium]